jgi:ribosome-binding protein aMBF1 (putative translation factor)
MADLLMDDLEKYIAKRKKVSAVFAQDFDAGYEEFKIGVVLRQAREQTGITQEELALKLHTRKSAISRASFKKIVFPEGFYPGSRFSDI